MISTQAGLFLAGQDEGTPQLKYAAKSAGYSEIEIHLNPESHHQSAGAITGCKVLRVFPAGNDRNNVPQFEFEVGNGDISFAFDEKKYEMVAYLLDDKERGTVSPVGYNRDLLASHTDLFIVPDPAINADVQKRADKIRVRALEKEKERENMEVSDDLMAESVDDLDAQIKALQDKKATAMGKGKSKIPPKSSAPVPGNKPPEMKQVGQKSKPRRTPMTPEERKAWGADMKRRREEKKKAKAGIDELPKEENAVDQTTSPVGAAER